MLRQWISGQPLWITLFMALLVVLPLPFGANRPWASDLFALLCAGLLAAMMWAEHQQGPIPGVFPRKRLWASAFLLSIVILWAFAQIFPFMPQAWHHPVWQESATLLDQKTGTISINPGLFPESLVRFVSYIVCFVIALMLGKKADQAKRLVHVLAGAGLVYAFYGLLAQSMGGDTILWFKKWAYQGFLTSTFVNKNSYAAYAGLGLLCCAAVIVQRLEHFTKLDAVIAHHSKAAAIFAALRVKDYLVFLSPVLIVAALALTGSRAGIASTVCGFGAFALCLAANQRWRLHQWGVLIVGLLFVLALFVGMGGDAVLSRVGDQSLNDDSAMRITGYGLVMQAITDNPWLGFGLGTFDTAFRLYRDASLPQWFHHAHNDYLEMIMDLGLPVALMLFAAIFLQITCCLSGVKNRKRNAVYPALAVGASVLLSVHALVDFSFHIPAIAATYAALLGLGVAQSTSSRPR